MGAIKRYLEDVSVDLGLDGEITDEVVQVAQARWDAERAEEAKRENAERQPESDECSF